MIDRRQFVQRAGALMLGAALPAVGYGSASAPGRLVFGIPAGSVGARIAEVALRLMASQYQLDYRLDVIDQRNTQDASETVKAARPDGTTLLQAQSGSMVIMPNLYRKLNYDPVADFTPLAVLGEYPFTLTVGPAVPASVTDIDGYIKWVTANPEYRDLGFAIYGSQVHLISLMLARSKEIALRPLPYKSPRSLAEDIQSGSLAAGISLAGSGAAAGINSNIRTLAISSSKRAEQMPKVATFAEQGLPEINLTGWYAWFAPAHTPPAVVQALHEKILGIQTLPDYQKMQNSLVLSPLALTPEQIVARMRQELVTYRDLINRYGLSQMA
ncbi:tripartite tricarboxylate transporter substrate-binding protein [Pseudomonas sp. dw_358]|uniref:Bug family tripartite tricarboxylate transporter substrate binding protein n=1 Tax=Pseudomonas sp. dw_358 TaxID=2720083 RepID=UPI001BD61BF1|nr:tripartite tricarboxylate transporter substrate-binding protein [Pseudomonas sp. dw_358]